MDDNNKSGSGDTYNITVTVGYAESVNPSAKYVNIYRGVKPARGTGSEGEEELDKIALKEEIIQYVSKVEQFATEKWSEKIEPLWNTILSLPLVDAKVYKSGKQNANFNRNLVANIIRLLRENGVYELGTDKAFTIALDGDYESPVRAALALKPDTKTAQAILKVIGK